MTGNAAARLEAAKAKENGPGKESKLKGKTRVQIQHLAKKNAAAKVGVTTIRAPLTTMAAQATGLSLTPHKTWGDRNLHQQKSGCEMVQHGLAMDMQVQTQQAPNAISGQSNAKQTQLLWLGWSPPMAGILKTSLAGMSTADTVTLIVSGTPQCDF